MPFRIVEKSLPAFLVTGVVFFAGVIGIYSRHFGQLAHIWPANSMLLWMMITYPRMAYPLGWFGAACGYLLAGWFMGDAFFFNVWLGIANLAGVGTGYFLFRILKRDREGLTGPKSVFYLLLVCGGAATASAVIGTCFVLPFSSGKAWTRFILWFSSELNRHLVLLPVCFAGRKWFSMHTLANWHHFLKIGKLNLAPAGSLIASVGLAAMTGGPGAIAFPVPALLWCALSYTVLPMCLIILIFNASVMGLVEAGLLNFYQIHQKTSVIVSFRLGLSFLVLGPLTVSAIMTTQRALVARLNQSITWDSLTKVLSRQAYLEQSLSLVADNSPMSATGIAILMLDIDHFKNINDTYGHFIGDSALVAVAEAISGMLHDRQICGRLGGEEFAVTIEANTEQEALQLAEKIRSSVEKISIPMANNAVIHMTVSIGTAYQPIVKELNLRMLLAQADAALYRAKSKGRNQVEYYTTLPVNGIGIKK